MPLPDLKAFEVWLVTGSQHLYGPETLQQVADHAQKIADALNKAKSIPVRIIFKPVVKTPEEILCYMLGSQYIQRLHWYQLPGCIHSLPPKCGSMD